MIDGDMVTRLLVLILRGSWVPWRPDWTSEYADQVKLEEAERQKAIDAMMRDYEQGKKP